MFLIALVLVALLSFAGVVSADNYYKGAAPKTNLTGSVTGGVDVQFADTWNTTPVEDWSKQQTWANFTINVPSGSTLKFAEFYVVDYCGSMTADYYGNMTVRLFQGNTEVPYYSPVVVGQPLALKYVNSTGANYSVVSAPLINLSRTTSDYVAIFEATGALSNWGNGNMNVSLTSYNVSGRFDGRFKSAHLIYGWDTPGGSSTEYWINNGNDPITKYIGTYTGNKTVFNIETLPRTYVANLSVEFVAGNSTSGPGYGKYWFNGRNFTAESGGAGGYPPADWTGTKYAGINNWKWNDESVVTTNEGDNILEYSRTNDYYKIIFGLLTVKDTSE